MARSVKQLSKKAGLPPGTPVHIGEMRVEKTKVTVFDYTESEYQERVIENVDQLGPLKDRDSVTWINVEGVHQTEIIEGVGRAFDLHPLLLEDIMNTLQRPKVDDYESHLFVVVKMLDYDEDERAVREEQVSMVISKTFVITFQELKGDVFDIIRDRIRHSKGRIRKMGNDYLAYALMDAIVDHYFLILEKMGQRIEEIEKELSTNPTPGTMESIHRLRNEMIMLRKSVWPLREVVGFLERGESELFVAATRVFLRDLYDHTIQVMDTLETYRDLLAGMLDLYLSTISNRTNQVVKVLTMIATIFIPSTLLVSIYGMNFDVLPGREWPGSFYAVSTAIIAIGLMMVTYFRKKKWI